MPKSKKSRQSTLQKGVIVISSNSTRKRSPKKKGSSTNSLARSLQTSLVLSGAQGRRTSLLGKRLPSLSPCERQYLLALRSPFHPDAMGVVVPGLSSQAATSFCVRWKAIFTFPTNGTTTSTYTMGLVPNPVVYGYTFGAAGGPISGVPGHATTEGGMTIATTINGVPSTMLDATNINKPLLANLYSTFRTVAGGVRLNSLTSVSNNTFTLSTYQPPAIQANIPYRVWNGYSTLTQSASPDYVGNATAAQVTSAFFGTDLSNASSANLINSRRSYTGFEIQANPLTLSFQPNNPIAHVFRETSGVATVVGDTGFGNEYAFVDAGTTSSPAIGGDSDITNNEGWDGILMYITSPPSVTGSAGFTVMEVEYILHCEGIPITTIYTGIVPDRPREHKPTTTTSENLIGYVRSAFDYAATHPRLLNGMADMILSSGGVRNYAARNSLRLGYQTGEF